MVKLIMFQILIYALKELFEYVGNSGLFGRSQLGQDLGGGGIPALVVN